jgi:2-polyprenyl-3-methyl-5-hydroxy-6-metoxy-1,4-benzoquinol methylase
MPLVHKPMHSTSTLIFPPGDGQLAIDLGCGHGVHSIPLARRGYQVACIDSSAHLIAELEGRAVGLPVQTVNGDLTEFPNYRHGQLAALIVCMGDTITHLPSEAHVWNLIRDASTAMTANGLLCFSLRDYASSDLMP